MEKQGNTIVVQTERRWGILAFLLVFVLGVVLGFGTSKHLRGGTQMSEKSDTVYIPETLRIPAPPVTKYIKTTDTFLVQIRDTLLLHDTTYLVLQKEEKEYKGEDYYAKVSGYRPSLDYIEVYPKTTVVTTRIDPDKNEISIGVGVGYSGGPYIPIYLEYERVLHKNFSIHGRTFYELTHKKAGVEAGASFNIGW
jgi:hypothetical protein